MAPEVLPADVSHDSPPQPARRRRPLWLSTPATYLLVGINCAVYLAMVAHGISWLSPTVGQVMNWGANNAGSVLLEHQWWRIVTAMFLHVGIIDLSINMVSLWVLAQWAEPLMGSMGLIAVYLLTGAAGNLLSTLFSFWHYYPNWIRYHEVLVFPAGAGASGAIFGIAGALIVLLKHRLPLPPEGLAELKKLRKWVIYVAVLNLVLDVGINMGASAIRAGFRVDNMAHLGGCMSGMLFAAPMVPRLGSPRKTFNVRLRIAVAMVAGLLVLFGFYLAQLPPRG